MALHRMCGAPGVAAALAVLCACTAQTYFSSQVIGNTFTSSYGPVNVGTFEAPGNSYFGGCLRAQRVAPSSPIVVKGFGIIAATMYSSTGTFDPSTLRMELYCNHSVPIPNTICSSFAITANLGPLTISGGFTYDFNIYGCWLPAEVQLSAGTYELLANIENVFITIDQSPNALGGSNELGCSSTALPSTLDNFIVGRDGEGSFIPAFLYLADTSSAPAFPPAAPYSSYGVCGYVAGCNGTAGVSCADITGASGFCTSTAGQCSVCSGTAGIACTASGGSVGYCTSTAGVCSVCSGVPGAACTDSNGDTGFCSSTPNQCTVCTGDAGSACTDSTGASGYCTSTSGQCSVCHGTAGVGCTDSTGATGYCSSTAGQCTVCTGTAGATCTGSSGNVGFCSATVGQCIDCFNYADGAPVVQWTAVNNTFLAETITLPLGWFVMNVTADLDVVGTDPLCAGLRVLGNQTCHTVLETKCLTYTGGFARAPVVDVNYATGRITYSYIIDPSDSASRSDFGITINGSTMTNAVKVCRLIPEQAIGVDLPLDLSNFSARLPANMECHIVEQMTDIEIDSSGTLTLVNAMYLVEVGTDGRLSWSINETVYKNCTFSTVPTLSSMSCGARSCVVGTVMPSYTVNISALCLLSDGVTERQLPVMVVDNLANQYFTSAITAGPIDGATFVYLSTDVYSVTVPYHVVTAVVTANDGSGSWTIVSNGVGAALAASVTQTSDHYTNVTFTPGSLYPGTYNLSLSMVFALGKKFGAQSFEMGSDSATEQRTFSVVTTSTSNSGSSSGSSPGSSSRRRTAAIVGVFVGVTVVVVVAAAVHAYLKKRRTRLARADGVKAVAPFPIATC